MRYNRPVHDAFELASGTLLSPAAAGRPIVHRVTRELGRGAFLVAGVFFGLLGLGLGGAALALVAWPGVGFKILAAIELAFAALLLWLAATVVRQVIDARRFNRRRVVVTFGRDDIEIASTDGVERHPFAALGEHPLLRRLVIDARIYTIAEVRTACRQLAPDDPRRRVLELLALECFEPGEQDEDPSDAPARYVALLDDQIALVRDPADLADLGDAPRWRVEVSWDSEASAWMPRCDLAALTPL